MQQVNLLLPHLPCVHCLYHACCAARARERERGDYPHGGHHINRELHHQTISNKASVTISRLLCGGQGLRAGDPQRPTEVCMRKACTYCLSQGRPTSETLWHFLHECPLTAAARQSNAAKLCWAQPINITKLHTTTWSKKQLRTIRTTIQKMWQARQAFNTSHTTLFPG